jgi:peroxiredoxin
VSPDPPDKLASFKEQNGFTFPMLMDSDLAVTKSYGVLNEQSGKIPHPTAMIVNAEGELTYFRVDEDYKVRPPTAAELLPALEAAAR